MTPLRTWVLVADGAHARILENKGPVHGDARHGSIGHGQTAHEWMPVEGLSFDGNHGATHDLVTERQGRRVSSLGPRRSAIAAKTDPHRNEKSKFAARLADMLAEQLQSGAYHRLIIAAPPVTLGDLRNAISEKVRKTVVAEFGHDLTKIPDHDIGGHLQPMPI